MQTDPCSLMALLKDAIHDRHARMEALPYVKALVGGDLALQSYVGQLRCMAVIHATLEHELRQSWLTEMTSLLQSRPSRLAQLREDLSGFDRLFIPDSLEAVDQAWIIAEQIRKFRIVQPENLLAICYVLEGTTLGNTVHLPDVIHTFGDQVAGNTRYYSGYGKTTGSCWQEFGTLMNSIPMDEEGRERLVKVSHWLFDHLEALFTDLYPVHPEKWGFTASMLNPEAGKHSIPKDPREIEAAGRAARRCREEYPYFDERYQERGKSFANSDAAWLVTLTALPPSQLLGQVEWLGRVLGNRGMPRITLERQLILLHMELAGAGLGQQEQGDQYAGLLEAAKALRVGRLRRISEERFNELAQGFHAAVSQDKDTQGRLSRTGELLVSAVCDEAEGIAHAVPSLLAWLTNQECFSQLWISEVLRTVEMARATLRQGGKSRS